MIVGTRYDVPFSGGDLFRNHQSFQRWCLDPGLAYVR